MIRHPAWCSRNLCTVGVAPEVTEEFHRSVPIIVSQSTDDAVIFVYLTQPPLEQQPDVDLLVLPTPVTVPFWRSEPVLDRLTLDLSTADKVRNALTAMVAEATR